MVLVVDVAVVRVLRSFKGAHGAPSHQLLPKTTVEPCYRFFFFFFLPIVTVGAIQAPCGKNPCHAHERATGFWPSTRVSMVEDHFLT